MEYRYPVELSSGLLAFPDTHISGNLAPVSSDLAPVSEGWEPLEQRLPQSEASKKHARSSLGSLTPPLKKRQVLFCCEPCNAQYKQKRALARHYHTTQHRRNVGLPPATKYACNMCEKSFSRDHDRARHMNEAHRGCKRSTKRDARTPMSTSQSEEETPRSQRAPTPPFELNCVLEQSFIIEEDVRSVQTGWDTLSTTIEVYPGPANRTLTRANNLIPSTAYKQPKRQGSEAIGSSHARNNSAAISETPTTDTAGNSESQGRNSSSWFADSSDTEDESKSKSTTKLKLKSTHSTTADSAVDLSEEAHEPKRPSITTIDYRSQKQEDEVVVVAKPQFDTELASFSKMTLEPRPRMTVIQQRGKTTTIPASKPLLCVFCDKHFEEDEQNLLAHLRQHLDMFRGDKSNTCVTCKIGFVHKADLDKHVLSANIVQHCGFGFDHKHACTGHHRPERDHSNAELSDSDRFRLCVQLRDWEQSQLRAYMVEVEEVVAKRNARASACYSVEALFRRSRSSFSSFAISVNTFGSAPCDVAQRGQMGQIDADGLRAQKGQMDIGGLKQRLKMMSLKDSTSHMRHTARKFPHVLRSGSINRSLYNAATSGDLQQIEQLVNLGGQPNAVVGGRSVLSAASQFADADTVRLLIGLGASSQSQCGTHGSALASAAHEGRRDIVELLLDDDADVNRVGGKYGSALGAAVHGGHIEVARLLLARDGINVNAGECALGCPLSIAAKSGSTGWVRLLLDHGADPDQLGGDEGCPLGSAVWHGHYDIVRQLVAKGADVNARGNRHGSPLCAAILKVARGEGSLKMVRLLLELGADVNLQGEKGNALRTAASYADVAAIADVVKVLLARNADVHSASSRGNALQLAKRRRQHWMDKKPFLLEDVDDGIDEIIGYCYEVIRLLKEAGASDEEPRSASGASRRMTG